MWEQTMRAKGVMAWRAASGLGVVVTPIAAAIVVVALLVYTGRLVAQLAIWAF
jgi:hypothetical protein